METNITALDTQTLVDVGLVQPAEPVKPDETHVAEPPVTEPVPPATPVEQPATPPAPPEFEIEGIGKVTPEQIKEWHSGSLRQSDYTKKTQEIARQKEELKEAQELFEYLKANPHLVQQLQDAEGKAPVDRSVVGVVTPEHRMVQEVFYNQMSMMIDKQIEDIKSKYKVTDLDEAALFDKARELGTNDLEFVYRAMSYGKETQTVDERALIEKAKEELRKELQQNQTATHTIVSEGNPPVIQSTGTITEQEKRVAAGMGLSAEDYIKWRDR